MAPNLQVRMPFTQQALTPALLGKGCKTERDATAQPVNAM
ncbi:hypothetical protein FF1_026927 [Malus domestica]